MWIGQQPRQFDLYSDLSSYQAAPMEHGMLAVQAAVWHCAFENSPHTSRVAHRAAKKLLFSICTGAIHGARLAHNVTTKSDHAALETSDHDIEVIRNSLPA